MYYYLAHIPQVDVSNINIIRKQFDPNYEYAMPHIAVVFPVDSTIGKDKSIHHIDMVIKETQSFAYSLSRITKSWDHYMYLEVGMGIDKFEELHDKLYTGILKPYLFVDVGYKPHITLGFFADRQAKFDKSDLDSIIFEKNKYEAALSLTHQLNLNFTSICSELVLISRQDKTTPAVVEHEFTLSPLVIQ